MNSESPSPPSTEPPSGDPSLIKEQAAVRPTATIGTSVEQLDLGTVMKISQAVSGEIVLEKLIETLTVIALEHAGAERGLLILPHGEELRIAAEARTGPDNCHQCQPAIRSAKSGAQNQRQRFWDR